MIYVVPQDLSILDALLGMFPQSSKTTLRSWIKEGRIFVDNEIVKASNIQVSAGQVITLGQRKKYIKDLIPIIYEDKDLVVIDKPTGLLSVAAAFEKAETAHGLLKAHYKPRKIYVVHRLDQDTSGALLFAFNETAYEKLKSLFEKHDIERSYTAIVEGQINTDKGTWKSYLTEDANYKVHMTFDSEEGEEAITHYETIATSKHFSWLRLTLETGKKNQIRVHCQACGHPVVGDKKYGSEMNPIKRLCLHAHLLAFKHPTTNKILRCEAPMPENFYKLIKPSL